MLEHDWFLTQLARERQRDLARELERNRLVRLARSTHGQRRRRLAGVSAGLGRLLIALGERLQARQRALLSDAALHAAHRSRSTMHTHRG
jgi:hypothetical protein